MEKKKTDSFITWEDLKKSLIEEKSPMPKLLLLDFKLETFNKMDKDSQILFLKNVADAINFFKVTNLEQVDKIFYLEVFKNLWKAYLNDWNILKANSITCPSCKMGDLKNKYRHILCTIFRKSTHARVI